MRVTDHRKQALVLAHPIDNPVGVEDLVPAVLGIRLREHHELHVGRIASEAAEVRVEVVDLVGREREAELAVGALDRPAAFAEERYRGHRSRRDVGEQDAGVIEQFQHRFGHPIVQERQQRAASGGVESSVLRPDAVPDPPFDAADRVEPAIAGDVGRLR